MIIIGIDPGTIVFGYGVVEYDCNSMALVSYGAIRCPERWLLPRRLCHLYDELARLIEQYHPQAMAIEAPFLGENAKSTLAIGKAQAIAMLAAAQRSIPVFEYPPAIVKQHVANYGASSKEQMQEMVRLLLDLDTVPQPYDAADALAVAICHSQEIKFRDIATAGG